MESYSKFTSRHHREGFQSVKDSSLCWSTNENSQQLEQEKLDHIKFSNDNEQFIKGKGYQKIWHPGYQGECSGTKYRNSQLCYHSE